MRVDVPDFIVQVADRVVLYGTQNTTSGNYFVGHDAVADLISAEDFARHFDLIADEVRSREEVLDLEANPESGELDCNFGLGYCPNYEWCEGDESIFGSYEEWLNMEALPVTQKYRGNTT